MSSLGITGTSVIFYNEDFGTTLQQQPITVSPFLNYQINTIPQPEVKRYVIKQITITAGLKDFEVAYTDSHGNTKRGQYSKEELAKDLENLLAKLTKEPKEE